MSLITLYKQECSKQGLAVSNALVLVEWGSIILQRYADKPDEFDEYGLTVGSADAQALEICLRPRAKSRKSIQQAALRATRRAISAIASGQGQRAIGKIVGSLASKSQSLGLRAAPFLGTIGSVCSDQIDMLSSCKSDIYSFYAREILGSRSPVPTHIASGLGPFFAHFATLDDLRLDVTPALERAILRAPEVVLHDLITPFVQSIPEHIDLANILADSLVRPLLANIKSKNESIRNGAVSGYLSLAAHSSAEAPISNIIKQLLELLLQSKVPAERQYISQMLEGTPITCPQSNYILDALIKIIPKETNEGALAAEVGALFNSIRQLPGGSTVSTVAGEMVAKGAKDQKPSIRRLWVCHIGDFLWAYFSDDTDKGSELDKFVVTILRPLLDCLDEVFQHPLVAAQNGLVISAFVATALWPKLVLGKQEATKNLIRTGKSPITRAMSNSSQVSFLFSHRIYAKVDPQDCSWLIRALCSCCDELPKTLLDVQVAWGEAFIYTIASAGLPPHTRNEAAGSLTSVYLQHTEVVAPLIIRALWKWHNDVVTERKDTPASAAKTSTIRLSFVLRSICPSAPTISTSQNEKELLSIQEQLIKLLVLGRPEIIPGAHWIELCIRMGQDPGRIAQSRSLECLREIESCFENNDVSTHFPKTRFAAYNAAAELAFVCPEVILPLLVEKIQSSLSSEEIAMYGPTEIAISRTPEGTAFVDVLSTQTNKNVISKNSPDYEVAKWEEEMRSQIAQKKGHERKLTTDEKAKVNAQLRKESEIRLKIHVTEQALRHGAGLVRALATGPPTDPKLWIGPSLKSLLEIIDAGAGRLIGDAADDAYLACAILVSTRLGIHARFIGLATLRASGSTTIPQEFLDESLHSMTTRLLYRIHFLGGQRPFDIVSMTYLLPFVSAVLRTGGLGQCDADAADEQVTLALQFLEFHSNEFSDTSLPRAEILDLLISCMQRFNQHYKLIKDCLLGICGAIAASVTEPEINILLNGAILPQQGVRNTTLQTIREHIDLTDLDFCEQVWLASHDDVDENATLGKLIWEENALDVEPSNAVQIMPYLASNDKALRSAASRALIECLGDNRETFTQSLHQLQEQYRQLAKPRVPEKDAYGMPKKMDLADPWQPRSGIALAFKEMAPIFDSSELVPYIDFIITDSVVGDRNAVVRDQMIDAATAIIALHGASKLEDLMHKFEVALDVSDKGSTMSDLVSEAIVILYGALARHLPDGDDRVPRVVNRLLSTLSTPSETVQYAVAACLPPLIKTSSAKTSEYIQYAMGEVLQSKKYAARRGAAYGLAGIVKGNGVSALKEYRILSFLKGAIENKKDQNQRQGALFAYELLSLLLGRIFEPYIIQIMPQLLSSFGDAAADVREACLDASKSCFSNLSSYGVKIILPTLLEGLEESQWRSKKGACDLLGAMAYLDPQQLAISLPEIIPPLTNVLNDSHKEVRAAANRSLQRFGEVISNPEVKGLVTVLLKALSDPTKYTDDALEALIKVSFVHYIDSPSLALIVRILQRGLNDRSATKRKSAQIIGSLAHLTERKDVISHLPILVAGLRLAVIDPVPATRATASKALGSLIEKLGEDSLPDLIPSLMTTLKSDTGAGDRLGSAQALSEVLAGLGTGRLEETLPTILQNVASTKATVREGFMSLFIYLPACFGNNFANYLSKVIPPILAGLADEIESIRETSLRAGRLLVKNFATRAIDLLLPELDRGLANDNYRIRLSSVELVGDLLFSLTGISGKTEQDEGEEDGATEAGQSLLEVLGEEKRNKILSSLYICRCDTSGLVRTAAINVWKALVATPRTLKELVPTLTQLIIRRLASSNMEQKVIAGNALGELIRKAGEGVLASLLPTLEEGLQTSTDTDHRQGICIALREITSSASPEALEDYEKTLISVVRVALVDSDSEVREAAAEAFDSLQQILGKKAVDQVLPYLLSLLRSDEDANTALSALLTLLTDNTRSNIILPNLVPTLLVSPISSFNARAIASLAQVAGPAMNRRLSNILNALMDNIVLCKDEDLKAILEESFDAVFLSIDEFDGLNTAMSVMLTLVKNTDHRKRSNAGIRLAAFFAKAEVDFSRYYQDLIRVLLISFDDPDTEVVKAAWLALSELTKRLKKEEMESLVFSTRQILQQVGVAGANLPGFMLPKGINAVLPIFLQGLMNGTADQRTNAALAISDVIDRSSADSLKPFVTQITGPLIRVVSERSVDVKAAILLTLNNLLEKIPTFLKPFLPQLQRTFAKCLADPSSEVLRSRAARALGTLITLTPRVDPLVAELVTGSKTPDSGVQNSMMRALFEVVSKAGGNMSEASRNSILGLIDSDVTSGSESTAITYARLFGALIKSLPAGSGASGLLKSRVLTSHVSTSSVLNLNAVLLESPTSLTEGFAQETPSIIGHGMQNKNPFIADNCVLAAGKYLLTDSPHREQASPSIIEALAGVVQPGGAVDTRRLALVVIRTVSRSEHDLISPHLSTLAAPIFASVRDAVIPVKLAAEAAFLSIFSVVDQESEVFGKYIADAGTSMSPTTKRSMQDYFKRVAMRLGTQARERREAEGGQGGLGLSNDEREDEREIWSVGKVDLGDGTFKDD